MNGRIFTLCAAALLQMSVVAPAMAQDDTQRLYNSSRNQLGLMKHCAEKGHIGAASVDAYRTIVNRLPPPANKAAGDVYEKEGAQGFSYDGSMRVSMEQIAEGTGQSVAAHCAQFEALTKQ